MSDLASQPWTGSQPEQRYAYLLDAFDLDVIKTADRVIDVRPEGGDEGGEIVALGTPERAAVVPTSYTG